MMKYFRLSNDEVMNQMSFADLVLLGTSIPKGDKEEEKDNKKEKVGFDYFLNKYKKG